MAYEIQATSLQLLRAYTPKALRILGIKSHYHDLKSASRSQGCEAKGLARKSPQFWRKSSPAIMAFHASRDRAIIDGSEKCLYVTDMQLRRDGDVTSRSKEHSADAVLRQAIDFLWVCRKLLESGCSVFTVMVSEDGT